MFPVHPHLIHPHLPMPKICSCSILCAGYIDAWENKKALERRRLHYASQVKTTREIYFGNRSYANLT
jgi:hypothetical protein